VQRRPWLRAAVPLTLARRQVGRVVAHDLADAVLIVLPRVPPGAATAALTRLEAGGRPLLAVSPDQHDAVTTRSFRNRSIPWYRDLDTAVGALAHARERSPTFGTGGQDGVGRETEGP